jgi:hypothetical protein
MNEPKRYSKYKHGAIVRYSSRKNKTARISAVIFYNGDDVLQDHYYLKDADNEPIWNDSRNCPSFYDSEITPLVRIATAPIETINREMILGSDDAIFYYHMGTMQPNYRELGILSDWEKWFENIQKDKNIRWAAIKRNYSSQIQPRKGLNLIIR